MKYASRFLFSGIKALKGRCMKSARADFIKLKDERGGSLVEFAIILPLLLILLFGIIEFGLLLYNQAVLTNASREGARFGIVAATPRHNLAQISQVVTDYCDGRLVTFGTSPSLSISATPLDTTTLFGDDLEVLVTWPYTFLAMPNLPWIGLTNPLTLSARTVMKYE
jgi:Flp pilus assembly protein TadG